MKAQVLEVGKNKNSTMEIREITGGPARWKGSELSKKDVLLKIPTECLAELEQIAISIKEQSSEISLLKPEQFQMKNTEKFMLRAKRFLDDGPGIAVIDRLPIEQYGKEAATGIYWLLGSLLGRPVAQNWEGLMLYDVRNSGKKHGNGVRGSVTNVELFYHTDNSYGLMPPQYIGLLCLETAKEGGESRLISWVEVFNRLKDVRPDLIKRGFDNFLFDRQKEHAPNLPAVISKPAFTIDDQNISVCYSSRLMRDGYKMAEKELDKSGQEFLDTVDSIINNNELQFKMYIERGQIQIINNSKIGHARSGFEDYEDPNLWRHLVRLWFREFGETSYDG